MGNGIPKPVGKAKGPRFPTLLVAVHPHAGSSRRPWGTHTDPRQGRGQRRFIPTHVGNARQTALPVQTPPVNPHARGERVRLPQDGRVPIGSSPRPWGTLDQRLHQVVKRRFIPTPVGNAPTPSARQCAATVHPHARGERDPPVVRCKGTSGLSPRPWGTLGADLPTCGRVRFIPTPVGNAGFLGSRKCWRAVHPHARGERFGGVTDDDETAGSSPRPWGTHSAAAHWHACWRFIPTPVGNAPTYRCKTEHPPVHHHARGERTKSFHRSTT